MKRRLLFGLFDLASIILLLAAVEYCQHWLLKGISMGFVLATRDLVAVKKERRAAL